MPNNPGHTFMIATRYENMEPSGEARGLPQPPLALPAPEGAPLIPLPGIGEMEPPALSLHQAIANRRTGRRYSEQPLSLSELAYLLWATQGVQQITTRPTTLRTVPSAGSRHAFETYLLVNRVEGLEPGLYRYVALTHELAQLQTGPEKAEEITAACRNQKQILNSAVTFLWAAEVERMTWRYGDRGYRYLHLDAGHICQNLYLAGEALDCRCCAIAAFDDKALNDALGLDGEARFVTYVATLGKKVE